MSDSNRSKIVVSPETRARHNTAISYLETKDLPINLILSSEDIPQGLNPFKRAWDRLSIAFNLVGAGFTPDFTVKFDKIFLEHGTIGWLREVPGLALKPVQDSCIIYINGFVDLEDLREKVLGDRVDFFLPGRIEDYNLFSALHEAEHCYMSLSDTSPLRASKHEYEADQAAARDYYSIIFSRGENVSPDVPYAFRALRTIRSMEHKVEDHSAAALVVLPSEEGLPPSVAKTSHTQLMRVTDRVMEEIGREISDPDTVRLNALEYLLTSYRLHLDEGTKLIIDDAIQNNNLRAAEEILNSIPEKDSFLEKIESHYRYELAVIGSMAAEEQPELKYIYAKRLLEEGAFDSFPAQRAFIERFIDSAQRYTQDYYGVPEDERKSPTPYADGELSLNIAHEMPEHGLDLPAQNAPTSLGLH